MKFICVPMTIALIMVVPASAQRLPTTAQDYIQRGMAHFTANRIAASLLDFDQAANLDPANAPQLWQRGISHYYAGKYTEGRLQFESHKRVNPYDVENATWHFICVARVEGVEKARQVLIEIDTTRDARVPMTQVYQFYAGNGSSEAILKAAEQSGTEQSRLYAHLYLGLYHEVDGKQEKARVHLRQAAAAKLKNNYMHEVAKIHLLQRNWDR